MAKGDRWSNDPDVKVLYGALPVSPLAQATLHLLREERRGERTPQRHQANHVRSRISNLLPSLATGEFWLMSGKSSFRELSLLLCYQWDSHMVLT
jgi:hypothetical protein